MSFSSMNSRSPIGLDVGSRSVKAVQLSHRGQGGMVTAATTFPRALPDAPISGKEVRRIIDVLYRHNFHGRDIVLSAPPLCVLDAMLELPSASDSAGLNQIARMEYARLQKCAPDALEMGYWPVPAGPRSHQANRVMAVGCLHREIEPLLETFESEGLRVVGLDAEPCAFARACTTRFAGQSGLTGLLDFGWNSSRLAVIYQGAIVFSRVLSDSGLASLFKSLEKHLALDTVMAEQVLREHGVKAPAAEADDPIADARHAIKAHFDAMLQELTLSFSYATQQYPDASLERVLVAGGGAHLGGAVERLTELLDAECVALAPIAVAGFSPALAPPCASPALTLALGLAQFCDE
jgi:Tfp pilus assembly PilM family ATPase